MNEQNSDSFSPGITTTVPKMSELTTVATQKRRRFLDIFKKDTQKKERMVDPKIMNDNPSGQVLSSDGTLTSTTVIPESSPIVLVENSISHPVRAPFSERISGFFRKKTLGQISPLIEGEKPLDTYPAPQGSGIPDENMDDNERFISMIKQDKMYQSMIRSQDVDNIQLQMAMRYMLLLFAIFVVIVWVINNRVIMFGFPDIPFLARIRDTLFALLTGLFSLTVWFGSYVWFRHDILRKIVRAFAILLFSAVLVSLYLPFWR